MACAIWEKNIVIIQHSLLMTRYLNFKIKALFNFDTNLHNDDKKSQVSINEKNIYNYSTKLMLKWQINKFYKNKSCKLSAFAKWNFMVKPGSARININEITQITKALYISLCVWRQITKGKLKILSCCHFSSRETLIKGLKRHKLNSRKNERNLSIYTLPFS